MHFPHTIRYWADFNPSTGYNNAARGYIQAMKRLGIGPEKLRVAPAVAAMPNAADIQDPEGDWLWAYLRGQAPHQNDVNIVHLPPTKVGRHHKKQGGAYNIAITAWETDRLPVDFDTLDGSVNDAKLLDVLRDFDDIWVPTELVKDIFVKAGLDPDKLAVIPHALLPQLLEREPRSVEPPPGRVFFYSIGTWNDRKNMEAVLRAYLATGWTKSDPVALDVHCVAPTISLEKRGEHQRLAHAAIKMLYPQRDNPRLPVFHPFFKEAEYWEVLDLHQRNHVLVTASRGEGFGIPVLEALALGNVVVASDRICKPFGDVAGYVDGLDGSAAGGALLALECRDVPIAATDIEGYDPQKQRWWDVDIDELKEGFLEAYELVRSGRMPLDVAEEVRDAYCPSAIAVLVKERLERAVEKLQTVGW
jgi:glycosyltransferase involved in cell wall biosynthesis